MKDYINSISAKQNITDAQRSPERIAERKAERQFYWIHGILFTVAVFVGNSVGAAGFLGVYATAIVFALGHDIGAGK